MKDRNTLVTELFNLSAQVRYIAIYNEGELFMQQRGELQNASSDESDKYEELLVNPTLIRLASQRGNIDCGGLDYLLIRYGHFFVLLTPTKNGHVNLGIEPGADPLLLVEPLVTLLEKHLMKP